MNVLLLSEHYSPKISGTVSYVKHLIQSLSQQNELKLYFLCPVQGKIGELSELEENGVHFLKLGVNENALPEYNREERAVLIHYVKENLLRLTEQYNINVVHLLYGLFLGEVIDTNALRKQGVKSVFTIHNIPPEECSISWRGDRLFNKLKDDVSKWGVRWINHRRIKAQNFDVYLTPSEQVKSQLLQLLPRAEVVVSPHGGAELIKLDDKKGKSKSNKLQILTVGGVIPHKRQDWIPEIAAYLKENKIDFEWSIVGPLRNQAYSEYVKQQIKQFEVQREVHLLGAVPFKNLESAYSNADVYIQLSREEGFCMTVLDAIAYSVPTMATAVGVIPEMLEKVGGIILDSDRKNIKKVILHYLKIRDAWGLNEEGLNNFRKDYTWASTAEQVAKVYRS